MTKCSFCGSEIEKGTGKTLFMKDGKTINFCSRKCEKNLLKLKRVARETPWTVEYKNAKQVRLGLLKEGNQVSKKVKTEVKETKKEVKKESPKKTK
ncbi:50S ribosomal protein L24e [Candidatus Woesearchaeota archaeon]|nr:50S ribosomal protein L24e [Candidatus Woesearchaeota archaeon]